MTEGNLFAQRWHEPFLFSFRVLFPGLLLRRGVDWPFEEAIWEHCPSLQGSKVPEPLAPFNHSIIPQCNSLSSFNWNIPYLWGRRNIIKLYFSENQGTVLAAIFSVLLCVGASFCMKSHLIYWGNWIKVKFTNMYDTSTIGVKTKLVTETEI